MQAYEQHVLQGGAASAMRYSVDRLRSKISLVKGFVSPGQLHLALQEDDVNKIEEVLVHRQSTKDRTLSCFQGITMVLAWPDSAHLCILPAKCLP